MRTMHSTLRSIDVFGYTVQLSINDDTKVKSKFGGFITLVIFCYSLYFFIDSLQSWFNNHDFQIIPSRKTFSLNEIYQKNQSILYDLDYNNYNIYFIMMGLANDGSGIVFEDLKRYLNQEIIYNDLDGIDQNLPITHCLIQRQQIFLQQTVLAASNATSPFSICLNQSLKMGLVANVSNLVNAPTLKYRIKLCQNSTNNNNSCASNDEIVKMLKNIQVHVRIPEAQFDFTDDNSPRKRAYDYQVYHLDSSLSKYFLGYLMPIFLKTDKGLFN